MVQGSTPRLKLGVQTVLALGAGLANALALAWPGSGQTSGPLHVVSLALLAHLFLRNPLPRHSAWFGWCFACAQGLTATWWLYISLNQYGGLAAPLSALAVLALHALMALFLGGACGLAASVSLKRLRPWVQAPAFVAAFLLAELAKGQWFTGFPWGAAGYAHVDSALAVFAPWFGVYGIGALATASAMALAMVFDIRAPLLRSGAQVMGLALILALAQAWRAPDYSQPLARVPVTVFQGNVPQEEKFAAQQYSAPNWYLSQLSEAGPGMALAPETAFPIYTDMWPAAWWLAVRPKQANQAFMAGVPWRANERRHSNGHSNVRNSVMAWAGLSPDATAVNELSDYRYDKQHLVPFGEFIPWGFHWFVRALNIPLGEFDRGPAFAASWLWGGLRWAPNICFEDLFGEALARYFIAPEHSPNVLVNFSNIAWFGDTVAQHQHLHISRLRTLELQRPMVRVTNTGSSAVIDHQGRVLARLPHWQQAVMRAEVEGRAGSPTFYAWWVSRLGLTPLWLLGLSLLVLAWVLARAGDRNPQHLAPR